MPHPLRTVLAAALSGLLGCLLLVAAPAGVQAVGDRSPTRASDGPHRFGPSEARNVLHRASRLVRQGAPASNRHSASADLTMVLRDLHLARPALTGADRRAANRLLSRSTAASQTPRATASAPLSRRCSTRICVHYGTSATSSWATRTLDTLENVWDKEVTLMGRAPLPDGGTSADPENPDDRFDVFLSDLGNQGYYGYCTSDDQTAATQVSAYCVLDDNFARSQYGAPPLNSLRVTAAHEFFHAIQFAFDISEDIWFMEGSATWVEDVVYDAINDNYQYLASSPIRRPRTSLDYSGGAYPYGSFIFFTYATARRGAATVRQFWDMAIGRRTSLQAIYAVVGAGAWPAFFTMFGSWNTLPLHSYQERAGYPSPAWWQRRTLTGRAPTTGWHRAVLSHLGSSAVLVAPGPRLSVGKRLLVNIDGPPRSSGSRALVQRRYRDGRVTHTMLTLGTNGNRNTLIRFNRKTLRSVVIVVANTNRYGIARGFKVRASLR